MQHDDGVCSDWFEVEQGLRQGCVLLVVSARFRQILVEALR